MGRAPERAERWQDGLEKAVASLEEFPERCVLVPEVSTQERQVRQLLYGAYRLLFTLMDTVRILHVRHGAQKPIMQQDPEEDE